MCASGRPPSRRKDEEAELVVFAVWWLLVLGACYAIGRALLHWLWGI